MCFIFHDSGSEDQDEAIPLRNKPRCLPCHMPLKSFYDFTQIIFRLFICMAEKNAVLYGYETWYLILGTEAKTVQEQGAEEDFGPKREKITEVWRKLHNGKLHYLYARLHIIRVIKTRIRWLTRVAGIGEGRNAHATSVGKPEKRRPRRPIRDVDNIKIKTGWYSVV